MNIGRKVIAAFLLVLLLVPVAAMAGQAPIAGDVQADLEDTQIDNDGHVRGEQDLRGQTWYEGYYMFWYQMFAWMRWLTRWGFVL